MLTPLRHALDKLRRQLVWFYRKSRRHSSDPKVYFFVLTLNVELAWLLNVDAKRAALIKGRYNNCDLRQLSEDG